MKKTIMYLIASLLLCTSLIAVTGCSQISAQVESMMKGKIQTGAWSSDAKTFTNEWSNIRITLPNEYRALTPEELSTALGAGKEIIVNDGNKAAYEIAEMRTAYDFMVTTESGTPNMCLGYENLSFEPQMADLDEQGYFDLLAEQITASAQIKYDVLATDSVTIADNSYFMGLMSLNSGAAYQNYYLRKQDGVMVMFILTYTYDTEDMAYDLIAEIKKAK